MFVGLLRQTPPLPERPSNFDAKSDGFSEFVRHPARLEVRSLCWMWVDVYARDSVQAVELVEDVHVPLVVAALSVADSPTQPQIEIVGVQSESEGFSNFAYLATAFFPEEPMQASDVHQAQAYYNQLAQDRVAHDATIRLQRGIELLDVTYRGRTHAAALLTIFQVIERCARAVPWTEPADADARRADVISRLTKLLNSTKATKKKVAAVREGAVALNRIDAQYLDLRIRNAGIVLGLGDDWVKRALEFSKLRNTHLGHPGEFPPESAFVHWLHPKDGAMTAHQVADRMIRAYLDWSLADK